MQDSISKTIKIKAPKEEVYNVITDPEQIVLWFPEKVDGSLKVGERPIFDFGKHGKNQVYIEAANPFEYFAYRWIPGSNHFLGDVLSKKNTLVEFNLSEENGVTTVVLTESGFASLPAEVAEQAFKDNSGGWEYMMGRLEKLLSESE